MKHTTEPTVERDTDPPSAAILRRMFGKALPFFGVNAVKLEDALNIARAYGDARAQEAREEVQA